MKKVLRNIISERSLHLPEPEIINLMKILVEQKKSIISLGPGEPDFGAPGSAITCGIKCLKEGQTHYSPAEGRTDLRKAIAKKLRKKNKINVSEDEVIVTTGSNEAILLSMMATIDPGEQVLVPNPGYLAFIPIVELLNGKALSIPLIEEDGFDINPDAIRSLIKNPKKVRALILNVPGNPTGNYVTKKRLEEIADIAVEHDLLIVSDEAYEDFVFEGKHTSIGSLNGIKNRVLSLFTFSKSHGMAGFRIGYAAGPKKIIDTMVKLHISTTLTAPTVSQLAALQVLKGPQYHIKRNWTEYKRRSQMVCKRINELPGFHCPQSKGAFYAFPKYDYNMTSLQFSKWLLKNAKVATVPGSEFGKYGEGHLRFSYATDYKLIEKAMDRIEKALKKIKK
jgi:aminotransferase